jgi:hypothetical protein
VNRRMEPTLWGASCPLSGRLILNTRPTANTYYYHAQKKARITPSPKSPRVVWRMSHLGYLRWRQQRDRIQARVRCVRTKAGRTIFTNGSACGMSIILSWPLKTGRCKIEALKATFHTNNCSSRKRQTVKGDHVHRPRQQPAKLSVEICPDDGCWVKTNYIYPTGKNTHPRRRSDLRSRLHWQSLADGTANRSLHNQPCMGHGLLHSGSGKLVREERNPTCYNRVLK